MIKRTQTTEKTINEAVEEFINDRQTRGLSKESVRAYLVALEHFINEIPITYCNEIKQQTIIQWITVMQNRGIKPISINHYLIQFRAFYHYCYENEYITAKLHITLLRGQEEQPKYYTDGEVNILLNKPSKDCSYEEMRNWAVVCFLLGTGARASTVCEIKITDINFDDGEILYRHLKNKEVAIIPLSQTLSKVLKVFINAFDRENSDGYLFCTGAEKKLTPNGLHQAIDDYCLSRGVTARGLHTFRHTFARTYILNGGSAFTLQHILCHSDISMTKHYVQLYGKDLKRDYERFSALDILIKDNSHTIKRKQQYFLIYIITSAVNWLVLSMGSISDRGKRKCLKSALF